MANSPEPPPSLPSTPLTRPQVVAGALVLWPVILPVVANVVVGVMLMVFWFASWLPFIKNQGFFTNSLAGLLIAVVFLIVGAVAAAGAWLCLHSLDIFAGDQEETVGEKIRNNAWTATFFAMGLALHFGATLGSLFLFRSELPYMEMKFRVPSAWLYVPAVLSTLSIIPFVLVVRRGRDAYAATLWQAEQIVVDLLGLSVETEGAVAAALKRDLPRRTPEEITTETKDWQGEMAVYEAFGGLYDQYVCAAGPEVLAQDAFITVCRLLRHQGTAVSMPACFRACCPQGTERVPDFATYRAWCQAQRYWCASPETYETKRVNQERLHAVKTVDLFLSQDGQLGAFVKEVKPVLNVPEWLGNQLMHDLRIKHFGSDNDNLITALIRDRYPDYEKLADQERYVYPLLAESFEQIVDLRMRPVEWCTRQCSSCGGRGWCRTNENCTNCGGEGRVVVSSQVVAEEAIPMNDGSVQHRRVYQNTYQTCPRCNGSGKQDQKCMTCSGTGQCRERRVRDYDGAALKYRQTA